LGSAASDRDEAMKVLIVDDDVVARMVLMDLIDRAVAASGRQLDVLEAEDGEQAWRQLDGGERPGLLFCDLRMPRLSGMELLARVKVDSRFARQRFVLASAASDAGTMREALGLGADGYVVKPFDAAKLRPHLDALAAEDEPPLEAARRLGIDRDRMLAYLGGLQRQLDEAAPEVSRLLASGERNAAAARLTRLAQGCRTLGIASAAAALDAQARAGDAQGAANAFEATVAAVLCRIGSLRGPA
jgi:two-component system chemotaxis response regulator CheY